MGIEELLPTMNQDFGNDGIAERIGAVISPEEVATEEAAPEAEATEEVTAEETSEEETVEAEAAEVDEDSEEEAPEEEAELEDDLEAIDASQFAQVLGIDEKNLIIDDDGSVMLRTNVNGDIGKVDVNDLIKSYQTDAHVTQKSQALADERKTFEGEMDEQRQVLQTRIGEAQAVSHLVDEYLKSEFNSIRWDELKVSDPGAWASKRQDFQDRVNAVNNAKQQAYGALQAQSEELSGKAEGDREQVLHREAEALRTALPQWNDPEVAAAQHGSMSKFLVEQYGFDSGSVDAMEDHRLVLLALDAQKYRESQATSKKTVKKIKSLPKITKPGASKGSRAKAAKQTASDKNIIRLKKSHGRTQDVARVLMDRI